MSGLVWMSLPASCSVLPKLTPRVSRLDITARVARAQTIVLLQTTAAKKIQAPVRGPNGVLVQLTQVTGDVLSVLRGTCPDRRLQYYFFAWADGGYSGPPLEMAAAGDVGVVFLYLDHGLLHAVNDVYLSQLKLLRGDRSLMDLSQLETVEAKIAYLLLAPATGADQDLYRADLHSEFAKSVELVGCDAAQLMLRRILVDNGPALEPATRAVIDKVGRSASCKTKGQ